MQAYNTSLKFVGIQILGLPLLWISCKIFLSLFFVKPTEVEKSEFGHEPGIIIFKLLCNSGELNTLWLTAFQVTVPLKIN